MSILEKFFNWMGIRAQRGYSELPPPKSKRPSPPKGQFRRKKDEI